MSATSLLDWIMRLPLCGEPELAGLLGVHELDVRREAFALVRDGWIESVEPGSSELEQRRRYLVRPGAAPALARAMECPTAGHHFPVRRQDTLRRIARFETSAGVNRLLAGLAADLRDVGVAVLTDARSLPLALPAGQRWWLPATEGYGCLRAGRSWAPFFVAWDRAAAPDVHRRQRLAAWARANARVAGRWGGEGLPPVLVVCSSEQALPVWEREWLELAGGDGPLLPAMLLTTRGDLDRSGSGSAVWRRPGSPEPALLVEQVGWGAAPPFESPRLPGDFPRSVEPPGRPEDSMRGWAVSRAAEGARRPAREHAAALALATGPREQVLIQWASRHPLLSGAELAVLTYESRSLVERRLDWLARCRAINPLASCRELTKGVM